VGVHGSGTIFLAGCNLGCVFCQNYDISHHCEGRPASVSEIVAMMLHVQSVGCHNINFVTPTHFTPQLAEAIVAAREQGLHVPIVYNCGGYESVEMLRLLDGLIEIYMPDMKYADPSAAEKFSSAPDYPAANQEAVREMWRQVGDLEIIDGIARRGLLVRHLVLPGDLAGSRKIIDFLAHEVSGNTYINVMEQYRPCFKACNFPELSRRPTRAEIELAREYAVEKGLRLD
jgi:putative pyruvate formate lyase activating enzyme